MDRIEKVILRNLVYNEEYLRKVILFIEPDYFNERNERVVFEHITKYVAEYNNLITKEVLLIEIEDRLEAWLKNECRDPGERQDQGEEEALHKK